MGMGSNPFSNLGSLDASVSSIAPVGNGVFALISSIATIIFVLGVILAVVLFVKSIMDRKKVKCELTVNSINSVKTTSIILLVLNVLSMGIVGIVLSIISLVFASNARNLLETNVDLATSKVNNATIINIVITTLTLISLIFGVAMVFIAGLANSIVIGL